MSRERAKEILYDETSDNQLDHIAKFSLLEENILNAMEAYAKEKVFKQIESYEQNELILRELDLLLTKATRKNA